MKFFNILTYLILLFIDIQIKGQVLADSELIDHPIIPRQVESELIGKEVFNDTVYCCIDYIIFEHEDIKGIKPKIKKLCGKVTRLSYVLIEDDIACNTNIFSAYMSFLEGKGFDYNNGATYLGFYKFNKHSLHPYVRNFSLENYSGPTEALYESHPAYQGTIYCYQKETSDGSTYVIIVQSNQKKNKKYFYIDVVEVKIDDQLTEEQIKSSLNSRGKLDVYGILFSSNSHQIQKSSEKIINSLANYLKNNPTVKILIVGHTDNTGNSENNLVLSSLRAESIKKKLIADYGIYSERITADGVGDRQPVADNETEEGRQLNRRVEIILQ